MYGTAYWPESLPTLPYLTDHIWNTVVYWKNPNGLCIKKNSYLSPKTIILPEGRSPDQLQCLMEQNGLNFPVIAKPDRGMRGKGIQKIDSLEELANFNCEGFTYLLQEFKDYKQEVGLFMFKHPETDQWILSSAMQREFPYVTGDGQSTLEQLIRKKPRTFLQLERWRTEGKLPLKDIIEKGEKIILDKIGNHRLGTKFMDRQNKISPKLEAAMGKVCEQIEGLEYCRLDIVFNSWEQLASLKDLSIIEINGANSEPAHVYDPSHSIFYAWKNLLYHFRMQYYIARKAEKRGEKALSRKQAIQLLKGYKHTMTDLH